MRRYLLLLLFCTLATLPLPAFAALTVTVEGAAVGAGGTAYVNVFVRSKAANTDLLDAFTLAVQITPLDGGPDLEFTDPPLDPQLSDPDYIFPPLDSAAADAGPPAGFISSSSALTPNDIYQGGDGTISGLGYFVPTTDTLLATIQVAASPTATLGHRFQISVIAGATAFFGPVPDDPNEPIPEIQIEALVTGIVQVVPEPSTLIITSGLLLLGLARTAVHRRKRRHRVPPNVVRVV
jgi:hypothetical protein